MLFMAIEPFFFDSEYYPASSEKPLAFHFPKTEAPNVRWYPLDQEAQKALEDLRDAILKYGNRVVVHRIPSGVAYPTPITIKAPAPVDEDALPPGLRRQTAPADSEQFTMSEIQKLDKGQIAQQHRPSDREPPKR